MLENYKKDEFGVIHQIEYNNYDYNIEYNNNYNSLGELGVRMGYLRLGNIIGSLGFVPKSILDIGVGNGDFIKSCKMVIDDCYINDITRINIDGCIWTDDIKIDVDVITMFDVLEHLPDMSIIGEFNCEYLVLSVPNCEYGDDDNWFENWKHRKPDEHLHHFNSESLIRFVESNGYKSINLHNIEDTIRKNNENYNNIITGIFKKIK